MGLAPSSESLTLSSFTDLVHNVSRGLHPCRLGSEPWWSVWGRSDCAHQRTPPSVHHRFRGWCSAHLAGSRTPAGLAMSGSPEKAEICLHKQTRLQDFHWECGGITVMPHYVLCWLTWNHGWLRDLSTLYRFLIFTWRRLLMRSVAVG